MRHVNEILKSSIDMLAEQEQEDRNKEAHRQGIAEARRILGETPDPEEMPEQAA